MAEIMLLCHGSVKEESTFSVPTGFVIWYIGIPGRVLPVAKAHEIVAWLKSDPTDPERAARSNGLDVTKYSGPGVTGPNFNLVGDAHLPTQFYDFISGVETEIDDSWKSSLGAVVGDIASKNPGLNNLFLLCCWE